MADKTEFEAMDDAANANNVQAAANLGSFVTLPAGYAVRDLEALQPTPNRVRQDLRFRDTDSLAAYLNIFQTTSSLLFSRPAEFNITAIVDYHASAKAPSHCDHRATFCAQFDAAYTAWQAMHGKPISQTQAGAFLEERAVDVTVPDAAAIMDMVMTFDAVKKVNFRSSERLRDGQRQFSYVEENEVRGAITLPESITIGVPVFEGMPPDQIRLRMKYRITEGSLTFIFEIHDKAGVERKAFERCEAALLGEMQKPLPMMRVV